MGSIKHIVAGMALAAALVGFAISFALRPSPATKQPNESIAIPVESKSPEAVRAEPPPPPAEKSPAPARARPIAQEPKADPRPVQTRIGGRDEELVIAEAGTLDGMALADVTTGQSSSDTRNSGLAHRMGANERITEAPAHEFAASANPPLKPQNLDKLLPLFGVQPTK